MTGEWPIKIVRLEQQAPPTNRSAWLLSPAVFLLAAAATFSVFYLRTGSAEATTSRNGPLLDPRAASIQLRVDTQSSGLMLSWNRYSPAVEAARDGSLHIDDGPDHRDLALDRNQILNGSIFYRPASQDVSFRLDLHGAKGFDVAQILRVLDARPHDVAKSSAPPAEDPVVAPYVPSSKKSPQPASKQVNIAEPTLRTLAPVAANNVPLPEPPVISQPLSAPDPGVALLQPSPAQPAGAPNPEPMPSANAPVARSAAVASYVPPRPLKWVKLDEGSLGMAKLAQGVDVKVKIKIDESGNVTSAHALIDGPKRDKKLMAAAARAVREWKFEPAQAHGSNVPSEETIVLHFGPETQ
jgi:TonB family protein